jgi:hypothetical protein
VLLADRIAVDDCKIAAAVVVTLALGAIVLLAFSPAEAVFTGTLGLVPMAAFTIALGIDVRARR